MGWRRQRGQTRQDKAKQGSKTEGKENAKEKHHIGVLHTVKDTDLRDA